MNGSLAMMYEAVRGALAADDELSGQWRGDEISRSRDA
jgi:hypothetical protein